MILAGLMKSIFCKFFTILILISQNLHFLHIDQLWWAGKSHWTTSCHEIYSCGVQCHRYHTNLVQVGKYCILLLLAFHRDNRFELYILFLLPLLWNDSSHSPNLTLIFSARLFQDLFFIPPWLRAATSSNVFGKFLNKQTRYKHQIKLKHFWIGKIPNVRFSFESLFNFKGDNVPKALILKGLKLLKKSNFYFTFENKKTFKY